MCTRRKTSGFTLIELLVVIAIIAILAAILFPVFAQARESARITSCLSNMKQIMTGMLMYSEDYDEVFPGSRIIQYPNPNSMGDFDPLVDGYKTVTYPYIKNKQVWLCPSNPNRDQPMEEKDRTFKISYASNGVLIYDTKGTPQAQLGHPTETFMFCESLWGNNDLGDWVARIHGDEHGGNVTTGDVGCQWGTAFYQHRGAMGGGTTNYASMQPNGGLGNWAFFDGHAKATKMANMFVPKGTAPNRYSGFGFEDGTNTPDGGHEGTLDLNLDSADNMCPLYR